MSTQPQSPPVEPDPELPDWANDPEFIYRFGRRVTWTDDPDECSEFHVDVHNDYGQIQIDGERLLAHRVAVVLETRDPLPEGAEVHHECENPACVNAHHLSVVSVQDHGRISVNRLSDSRSDVTPQDVRGIKMCLEHTDMKHKEIKELHGLPEDGLHITQIKNGYSWAHIDIPHAKDED